MASVADEMRAVDNHADVPPWRCVCGWRNRAGNAECGGAQDSGGGAQGRRYGCGAAWSKATADMTRGGMVRAQCVGEGVPCKYFAATGVCEQLSKRGRCREIVGNRAVGNYVTKVHDNAFADETVDTWLSKRLPLAVGHVASSQLYEIGAVIDVEGGGCGEVIELPCILLDLRSASEIARCRAVRPRAPHAPAPAYRTKGSIAGSCPRGSRRPTATGALRPSRRAPCPSPAPSPTSRHSSTSTVARACARAFA